MKPRSVLLGTLSAAIAFLAAACSDSPYSPGPLGDGNVPPSLQCLNGVKGRTDTVGIYALENGSKSRVTVQRVWLDSPHGLTMTRTWVVPVQVRPGHFELIGTWNTWPPPASPEWAQRQPAAGAVILPGQTLNLVFGLTMTTTQVGHSRGPVITYTADGNGYTLQEPTGLRMGGNAPCYIH